jgi:G3E family GTPase
VACHRVDWLFLKLMTSSMTDFADGTSLPHGWVLMHDDDEVFYYHTQSKVVSFERPNGDNETTVDAALSSSDEDEHQEFARVPDKDLIPVTIVTGFLGAGKSTVVDRLLAQLGPKERLAIIENECGGNMAVDDDLMSAQQAARRGDTPTVFIRDGCICCKKQNELEAVLCEMAPGNSQASSSFDRVIIETSGLAYPGPIVSLFARPELATVYRVDSILCVVDAKNAQNQLLVAGVGGQPNKVGGGGQHGAMIKQVAQQVAMADRVVLNKVDLVDPQALRRLRREIAQVNQFCPVIEATRGQFELSKVIDVCSYSTEAAERVSDGMEVSMNDDNYDDNRNLMNHRRPSRKREREARAKASRPTTDNSPFNNASYRDGDDDTDDDGDASDTSESCGSVSGSEDKEEMNALSFMNYRRATSKHTLKRMRTNWGDFIMTTRNHRLSGMCSVGLEFDGVLHRHRLSAFLEGMLFGDASATVAGSSHSGASVDECKEEESKSSSTTTSTGYAFQDDDEDTGTEDNDGIDDEKAVAADNTCRVYRSKGVVHLSAKRNVRTVLQGVNDQLVFGHSPLRDDAADTRRRANKLVFIGQNLPVEIIADRVRECLYRPQEPEEEDEEIYYDDEDGGMLATTVAAT